MFAITDFQTSLLREKFIIHDPNKTRKDNGSVTALSNRMVITLKKPSQEDAEVFVIRAQNMHVCVRLAGRMLQSFNTGGSLLTRGEPYDWHAAWDPIITGYERTFNDDLWVAVYHRGKVIFSSGEHHVFLDLIEKCDYENTNDYDYAIPMAENAFKQSGKIVKIEYSANVALVLTFEKGVARCGVILRGVDGTTTFNCKVTPLPSTPQKASQPINIPQCLSVAAAFLEGVQLAYMAGINMFKTRVGMIERSSHDDLKTKEAQRRLARLDAEITNLDSTYNVRYRPEKPQFSLIMSEAEELAARTIETPKKKPKPFGADDPPPESAEAPQGDS
ncbi:MAG: hypothetical protein GW778_04770 [Alphaproteobacteria bacterium]|nr:hypothetical protein [Alphaproteobacteria bacterium]